MNLSYLYFSILIYLLAIPLSAQRFEIHGGLLLKTEITLGNQNTYLKIGSQAFGTMSYGDISVESGISFSIYEFSKRHTIPITGFAYSYEFFALGGIGQNSNLIGSTLSTTNTSFIFDPEGEGGFYGIGFGFNKDVLPKSLKSYGIRRGALLMRFSNQNHQIQIAFLNDFNIGWFNGEGTDYGITGSLKIGFTRIHNNSLQQIGLGLDLFTPQPDYNRSPRNHINSQDGRKNVWFTLPPYKNLFYGNFYAYGGYQKNHFSLYSQLGMNSYKSGAEIQNILHDGLGLNPRFPWPVDLPNKLYLETNGSLIYSTYDN